MPFKTTLLLLGIIFCIGTVRSQNIIFKFKDGTLVTYALSSVRNITYTGEVLALRRTDGSVSSWNVNTIANYRYDFATSVEELTMIVAKVKIYPNPFRSKVHIQYELPVADQVAVEILDLLGRSIRVWPVHRKTAGIHKLIWQPGETERHLLTSGTYLCRIKTTKGTVTKILVME